MSFIKETWINCDSGCGVNFGVDDMCHGFTAKKLRKQAKENGWLTIGSKDYCPDCAKEASDGDKE